MRRNNWLQSRNPVMRDSMYENTAREVLDAGITDVAQERMTVRGAIQKTFILAGILLFSAALGYAYPNPLFVWGGAIGGLITVLILSFRPRLSPTLTPVYAVLEGLFVGGLSAVYASLYSGIILQAVSLTIAALFSMLFIYQSGIIVVNGRFRMMIVMATASIALVYLVNLVLSLFGIHMPYLHQGGTIGIAINAVVLAIACLNLLLDFDNFEKGEQYGAPAYMEWFSAMGLLITLVWIYLELLRLLSRLRSD